MTVPNFQAITLVQEESIVWITLNRPKKLNAINDQLLNELESAFDYLADVDHRVVVIKGAGTAFSAGYDLGTESKELGYAGERGAIEDRDRQMHNVDVYMKLWRHPVPVIAQIHGYCLGGSTQLCVFADITVVADDAIISASPALPIGGGFISPLWATLVGPKRAKLLSYDSGHRISGKTASDWGWATESVPAAELDQHVRDMAYSIARTPASILKLKKEAVNRVAEMQGIVTIARMGTETDALLHLTPEVQVLLHSIRDLGLKGAIANFDAGGLR